MTSMPHPIPTTISAIHAAYKTGQLTPTDVVNYYLDNIKQHDKSINAFITVTDKQAIETAKTQDSQLKQDPTILESQPLFGIPIALKDIYMTEGVRSTAASKVLDQYIPQYSSTAWKKLEDAGAILIGKLNCDAWAHGSSGENSQFGNTLNPWDQTRTPGGSSSGSGAAAAARMAHITMGSDTGGSIRLPASFTNTVGLKPTYGRVSRYGIAAMASSLDSIGHFSTSVEDTARVLSVTAGTDQYDATTPPIEVPAYHQHLNELPKKLTIGLPQEFFTDGLDPEVQQIIDQAVKTLESNYHITFKPVSLPHTQYGIAVYYIIQTSEVSSNLGRYDGIRYGNARTQFGDEAIRRIMLGTYALSAGYYDAYYKKAMQVRTLIKQDYQTAFEDVDVLLTPVSPTPAFKLGQNTDDPLQMYLADILTVTTNLAGNPGLAVPGGFTTSGLPVGFQLIGAHFSEQLLFQLGYAYQKVTDHHTKLPPLFKAKLIK